MQFDKPLPIASDTTRPFWQGLKEGKVCIQHCNACGGWVFYPRSHCNHCLSSDMGWREVSGNGTLYTFTISRQATAPHFTDEVPQKLAVVELDEGVRLTTTLVNVNESNIKIGMRLRPYFDAVSADVVLLRYQPG